MIDREIVIKGIDICLQRYRCGEDCPYYDVECMEKLRENALALLKAQEPRVLTIEEATAGDECWFEHRNGACGYALCFIRVASQTVEINRIMHNPEFITLNSFMKSWRCWSYRPTDEQRKAVKWDA